MFSFTANNRSLISFIFKNSCQHEDAGFLTAMGKHSPSLLVGRFMFTWMLWTAWKAEKRLKKASSSFLSLTQRKHLKRTNRDELMSEVYIWFCSAFHDHEKAKFWTEVYERFLPSSSWRSSCLENSGLLCRLNGLSFSIHSLRLSGSSFSSCVIIGAAVTRWA